MNKVLSNSFSLPEIKKSLANEEKQLYSNKIGCCLCGKNLTKMKFSIKVTDHCHQNGNYRRATVHL